MENRVPAFERVDDIMAGVYRKMKPEQRLEIALDMWLSARHMLYDAIRSFHIVADIIASITQGQGLREIWEDLLERTRK